MLWAVKAETSLAVMATVAILAGRNISIDGLGTLRPILLPMHSAAATGGILRCRHGRGVFGHAPRRAFKGDQELVNALR